MFNDAIETSITSSQQFMIQALTPSPQQLDQPIADAVEANQQLNAMDQQITNLVTLIGQLKVQICEVEGQRPLLEATHVSQIKSLEEQEQTLAAELESTLKRVDELVSQQNLLKSQIISLQQHIDYLNSPAGRQAAFQEWAKTLNF